mgnify:CR=1 FL=1
MIKSYEEYINSLNDGRTVFYRGKKVSDVANHKILNVAIKHASNLYKMQKDEKFKNLLVTKDEKYGEISAFYKIPRNEKDLWERFNLIYETTRQGRGMFNIIKAIGSDAIFALMIVAQLIDKEYRTDYSKNVKNFYEYVIENDLALAVAQTDVKGDRSKRPSEQNDPDMYVRIIEKNKEGIIVRGAKAHTTQSIASNELIVIPTRNLLENDKDYAVAFAVPPNTKGIKMISRPMKATEAAISDPSFVMGNNNAENETLTIFDDVFVPWERVFMAGEWKYAGIMASMFPTFHRFTAIAYRAAMADLFLGLGKLISEHNGIENAPNIRRNIVNLLTYKENLILSGLGASEKYEIDKNTGIAVPNRIYTNIGKLFANDNYLNAIKNLVDIAGGLAATLPHNDDLENPDEKDLIMKYLSGAKINSTEERVRLIALVREIISSYGSLFTAAMLHAEGSIEASIIELSRSYNYDGSKKLALYSSGIINSL